MAKFNGSFAAMVTGENVPGRRKTVRKAGRPSARELACYRGDETRRESETGRGENGTEAIDRSPQRSVLLRMN
jgi:hypothetical protein